MIDSSRDRNNVHIHDFFTRVHAWPIVVPSGRNISRGVIAIIAVITKLTA